MKKQNPSILFLIVLSLLVCTHSAYAGKCEGTKEEVAKEIAATTKAKFEKDWLQNLPKILEKTSAVTAGGVFVLGKLPNSSKMSSAKVILESIALLSAIGKVFWADAKADDSRKENDKYLDEFQKSLDRLDLSQIISLCKHIQNIDSQKINFETYYNNDALPSANNWHHYCQPERCQKLIYKSDKPFNRPSEFVDYRLQTGDRKILGASISFMAVLNDIAPEQTSYNDEYFLYVRVKGEEVGVKYKLKNLRHGTPHLPQNGFTNFRSGTIELNEQQVKRLHDGVNPIDFDLSCAKSAFIVIKSTTLIVLTVGK